MSLLPKFGPFFISALCVIASLLVGVILKRAVIARLARLAATTHSPVDDAIIVSLRRPVPVWCLFAGLYAAARLSEVPPEIGSVVETLVLAAFIFSITLWAANLSSRLLQLGFNRSSAIAAPATGVVRYAVRIVVLAVGTLVLLSTLGISVTPVLSTVGIGGIAVALGLQDTLANLFAGMQLTLAGNLRVGHFVRLESGEEGCIEDIQWRSTRVRTIFNNFVLIPNSRLAQSVITNYHLAAQELVVLVEVGVHYASDLDQVEKVTCDVARAVMKDVPGGVPEFDPFIRFHTFGDSSINFTVYLRAREFTDKYGVKHEFIKLLARAFAVEKIVIPFPIRAINLSQEQPMIGADLA